MGSSLGGRDALNLYGGKQLPFGEWGIEFAQNLPRAIRQRLNEVRPNEEIDRSWKDGFAERHLQGWRQLRYRLNPRGADGVVPAHRSPLVDVDGGRKEHESRPKRPRNVQPQLAATTTTDDKPKRGRPAKQVEMAAAIPDWVPAKAEDMDEPYYVAAFDGTRVNSDGSRGAVLLNVEHDAVVQFVEEFQATYPPQVARPGRGRVLERAGPITRREGRSRAVALRARPARGGRAEVPLADGAHDRRARHGLRERGSEDAHRRRTRGKEDRLGSEVVRRRPSAHNLNSDLRRVRTPTSHRLKPFPASTVGMTAV
jgi:hypothetical protein